MTPIIDLIIDLIIGSNLDLILGSMIGFIIGSNLVPGSRDPVETPRDPIIDLIIGSIIGLAYGLFGLVIGQGLETLVVGYLSYFV